ncbi:hypothetical protein KIPB_015915, partial [Kipferlia bialata]
QVVGTCLNRGCIPSKAFIHPADLIRHIEHCPTLNVNVGPATIDYTATVDRVCARIDATEAGARKGLN